MGCKRQELKQIYSSKGCVINEKIIEGLEAGPQPDDLKPRKLFLTLGNLYVRFPARERRKVMRVLKRLAFRKNGEYTYEWERWTADDMRACYLQLQPVSKEFANTWRRWATELLKTGANLDGLLGCLMGELDCREWMEKP